MYMRNVDLGKLQELVEVFNRTLKWTETDLAKSIILVSQVIELVESIFSSNPKLISRMGKEIKPKYQTEILPGYDQYKGIGPSSYKNKKSLVDLLREGKSVSDSLDQVSFEDSGKLLDEQFLVLSFSASISTLLSEIMLIIKDEEPYWYEKIKPHEEHEIEIIDRLNSTLRSAKNKENEQAPEDDEEALNEKQLREALQQKSSEIESSRSSQSATTQYSSKKITPENLTGKSTPFHNLAKEYAATGAGILSGIGGLAGCVSCAFGGELNLWTGFVYGAILGAITGWIIGKIKEGI
jgi:hypothetical protein